MKSIILQWEWLFTSGKHLRWYCQLLMFPWVDVLTNSPCNQTVLRETARNSAAHVHDRTVRLNKYRFVIVFKCCQEKVSWQHFALQSCIWLLEQWTLDKAKVKMLVIMHSSMLSKKTKKTTTTNNQKQYRISTQTVHTTFQTQRWRGLFCSYRAWTP